MITGKQKEKARIFSAMHKEKKMSVLPNAWNVGSAYVFEKQGFKAVATSSAGIAYDLGYPDGENMSFNDLLWIVEKIANRVDIPLSVDFERGYGDTGKEIKENARKLLFAGAVGLNIEDGLPDGALSPLDIQIEKIKTLSELKHELDIDFVINARTCAYWLNVANENEK
jgi:2-methylisocitrate lyase-like PEP mutase family enzyme